MEYLKRVLVCALALLGTAASATVTLSNTRVSLVLGDDGCAQSLRLKATGEELLDKRERLSFFSVTQERPFDNELKLAFPNTRTTYPATSLRQEGTRLIVGFERKTYEAEVDVTITDDYLAFRLAGFRVLKGSIYEHLIMDVPAAASFRLVQLPLRPRRNFGEWLNVVHDEKACVAVVGTTPETEISSEMRAGARVLRADAVAEVQLTGVGAALVADTSTVTFLDRLDALERDFDLPRGVQSRRNPLLNASIYWSNNVVPTNVEEHIAFAKQGGFRMMLLYYLSVVDGKGFPSYTTLPDYEDLRPEFPNGLADIKAMLDKIKAAGLTPGIHTLQTHVGFKSRYVTPVADPRLNLKRRFTLAQPLEGKATGDELFVYENPMGVPMAKGCRILQFGGEMIAYTNYVATRPYRFTGVKRGHLDTYLQAHPRGQIGGILDVSEFGARSCYLDQRTDLQDEVAEKFAKIWNCGFEFAYFDGSEGVNAPCGVYVSLAQWRMTRQFAYPPLFTEGAAKSHFGWHLQAGANAFDMFDPSQFKAKIVEHPLAEAPLMRMDFTRVDFGWWGIYQPGKFEYRTKRKDSLGTQPDMWEFGSSKAAAWDCPATVKVYGLDATKKHPRINDLFTTLRRWEDVRARKLLTSEQKESLKDPAKEFHLVPNAAGTYDLVEWRQLSVAGSTESAVRAFLYVHHGQRVVVYWHCRGQGTLVLSNGVRLVADNMREWTSDLPAEEVARLFDGAHIE